MLVEESARSARPDVPRPGRPRRGGSLLQTRPPLPPPEVRLMHARFNHRRMLTVLFSAMLAGWNPAREYATAGEPVVGVSRDPGQVTIEPAHSRLIGRRATQQLL